MKLSQRMQNVFILNVAKPPKTVDRPRGTGMDLVFGYTDHAERIGRYERPRQQHLVVVSGKVSQYDGSIDTRISSNLASKMVLHMTIK